MPQAPTPSPPAVRITWRPSQAWEPPGAVLEVPVLERTQEHHLIVVVTSLSCSRPPEGFSFSIHTMTLGIYPFHRNRHREPAGKPRGSGYRTSACPSPGGTPARLQAAPQGRHKPCASSQGLLLCPRPSNPLAQSPLFATFPHLKGPRSQNLCLLVKLTDPASEWGWEPWIWTAPGQQGWQ